MLLLRKKSSPRSINFGNEGAARKALSRLGVSVTSSANARRLHNGKWIACSANSLRFSVYDSSGKSGLLVEDEQTNLCTYSSEDNAGWLTNQASKASAVSCINGKTAIKVTGTATFPQTFGKTIGTFSGGTEGLYMILEYGDSAEADISIFDATAPGHRIRKRLTFSTGAISTVSGASEISSRALYLGVGPNGGRMYLFFVSATTTGGNSRAIYLYPCPVTGEKFTYVHHVQLVAATMATSPIVTTSASVTRAADIISFSIPSWLSDTGFSVFSRFNSYTDNSGGLTVAFACTSDANHFLTLGAFLSTPFSQIKNLTGALDTNVSAINPDDYGGVAAVSFDDQNIRIASGLVSDSSATGSTPDMNTIYLGSGGGAYSINGHMINLKMIPVTLGDDALLGLVA